MSGSPLAPPLAAAIDRVAGAPSLLVASDFDGTLAPIAAKPWLVAPDAAAVAALCDLATCAQTAVAVVSARTLDDLRRFLGPVPGVRLYGSYGAEAHDGAPELSDAEARRRAQLVVAFERLAVDHEGTWVEHKTLGVALHARGAAGSDTALARAAYDAAEIRGAHVVRGDQVVEALVRQVSKASTVEALARRAAADAVVFLGDDHADEEVFAALAAADLGVRVGDGDTAASHRVATPSDVGLALRRLAARRRADRPPPDAATPRREELHHAC